MKVILRCALAAAMLAVSAQAGAELVLYERHDFDGRSFKADRQIRNLERFGFNDRASSAVVFGERWEVCEFPRFEGRCVILRRGRYPSLAAMGLNDRISSARPVSREARYDERRYAPEPLPVYDARRRSGERLYQVDVSSVRAVTGPPEQRCWVEQEQVVQDRGYNVPGAIAGAVIGGILGHQVGRGTGRDVATAGGAVAGGAIGANVGRGSDVQTRDVQRCASVPSQRPAYYDVTYHFRGQEHHVQMMNPPPGRTLTVNERGEPRA